MPRAGDRDIAKEQRWRQVFADQQTSGLGVTDFCRQSDIKVPQFYSWKKRIRLRDAERSAGSRRRMAGRANQIAEKAKREKCRAVEFAEVQLVDREPTIAIKAKAVSTGALEVVFASGTKVRLSADCSLALFASVVSLLENR
jgi:hypothetical protein